MKRFLMILLMLLLLAGCTREDVQPTEESTLPTDITDVTEPTIPWVEEVGMEWDAEGVLKEIPLTIPDGLHYDAAMEFDGDLLLWSTDDHLEQCYVELCLVELDDGSITAMADIPVSQYVYPQCLEDTLYLCDGTAGVVTALDRNFEIRQQWQIEQTEDTLIMGANGVLYRNISETNLMRCDLNTGESAPLLEGNPDISWLNRQGNIMTIRCFLPDTGAPDYVAVDLTTGECIYSDAEREVDSVTLVGDTWMYEFYGEGYIYDLQTGDEALMRIYPENATLRLMPEGYLLRIATDSTVLSLHELDGSLISACRVSARESGYIDTSMIWNQAHGGYFLLARSWGDTARLLFWDTDKTMEAEALTMELAPKPEEYQTRLEERAGELGRKYGVNILVGEQCDTVYDEFTATRITDYETVSAALNVLDRALGVYPQGFFRQLRYGSVHSITIQLISDLQADGSGRTGGGYNAFTQTRWEDALMVIDIDDSSEQTYYHEVSHIIDRYLEWDAEQREDALYSESGWYEMNPGWFDGYTYDYSWEQTIRADGAFIDGYATISPTEDRARVMEYAMVEWGDWHFQNGSVLTRKLEYYSRCIRDAFNTTGWTKPLPWEQFLA